MRVRSPARRLALLLTGVLAACGGGSDPDSSDPGPAPTWDQVTYVVAAEFLPYAELEAVLPELAAHPEVGLCLAVQAATSQSPELESLLRAAWRQGVPLSAWMLLPEADGYWYNTDNLDAARAHTLAFLDWIAAREIPLEWLLFDMELGLEETRQLKDGGSINDSLGLLQANLDPAAHAAGKAGYTQLVEEVQARGYVVTAAAYPYVIDDLVDGDEDLQDAFDTPIVGVPFDEVYLMTYRTSFASLLGMAPGPNLIEGYARDAREVFGAAGVLGLGTIGTPGMISSAGYTEAADLAVDVAASRAGGNERVFIFSLDGMLAQAPLAPWLEVAHTPPQATAPDPDTELIRMMIEGLDALLNST